MWAQYTDNNGELQWGIMPFYVAYFQQFLDLLDKLDETVNKKWKPEQLTAYQSYLYIVRQYINDRIWTGLVADKNIFDNDLLVYNSYTNPLGKELFDSQVDYIQKVDSGYDFINDKKKKKAEKPKDDKPQEVKKPVVVVEKK
jgi:hypothetical protein